MPTGTATSRVYFRPIPERMGYSSRPLIDEVRWHVEIFVEGQDSRCVFRGRRISGSKADYNNQSSCRGLTNYLTSEVAASCGSFDAGFCAD